MGSAGMVVEMYKNLTDRAGNSCFISQIALLPSVNTYYFFHQAFFIISTSNFILIKRNLFLLHPCRFRLRLSDGTVRRRCSCGSSVRRPCRSVAGPLRWSRRARCSRRRRCRRCPLWCVRRRQPSDPAVCDAAGHRCRMSPLRCSTSCTCAARTCRSLCGSRSRSRMTCSRGRWSFRHPGRINRRRNEN